MKKEQSYGLGGIAIGVLVALVVIYFYNKGNLKFPQSQQRAASNSSDTIRFGERDGRTDEATRPPRQGTLQVRGGNVTMRNCAGLSCREITVLGSGAEVEDLGEPQFQNNMEWVKVRAGNQEGWVVRSFLE